MLFERRAGKSFRPFRAHAEFKSGFQTNDPAYEIFYVVVLLDDGGGRVARPYRPV